MRFALCLLLLSGCAPTITGSNSRGGTIQHVIGLDKGDALRKADAECHKYGRVARISHYSTLGSSLDYDCVEP